MFTNKYKVKVTGKNIKRFLKKIYSNNIYIEDIDMYDDYVYLTLTKENYLKLKDIKTVLYDVKLIRIFGIIKLIDDIKKHAVFLITVAVCFIYFLFLSNIIFEVEVIHSKKEIRDLIYSELGKYDIKKYHLVKSYMEKEKIVSDILKSNKNKLEWIEIERIGVKYQIRVEERIINNINDDVTPSHIVAKKTGIIKKIHATNGEVRKKVDDYVKAGDIIISGLITKNDEVKNKVKAKGTVYAEVWYQAKIDMPYYYKEVSKTGKSKITLKLNILNKNHYFLNFKKYETFIDNDIFSLKNRLLPISLKLSREYETNELEELYTRDEAIQIAKKRALVKIENTLSDDEKVLKDKIISVVDHENYISVEIFYKVYENITGTSNITEEEIKGENIKKQ